MKVRIEIEVPDDEFESETGAERWLGGLMWDSLPNATNVYVEVNPESDMDSAELADQQRQIEKFSPPAEQDS